MLQVIGDGERLDVSWNDIGGAVGSGEHLVGFGVVGEKHFGGVEAEFSAEAVRDVAEVAEGGGEGGFFDFGVEKFGVTSADGVGEVGEMVEVRGVGDGRLGLFVAAEKDAKISV